MTDTESPIGERVTAVETDIKHVLDGMVRIEGSVARIENVVIKDAVSRLETGISETRAELKSDIARVEDGVRQTRTELKSDIARVEDSLSETRTELKSDIARVEDGVRQTRTELKSDIARVEGRITEMKDDLHQTLLAAMSENRKALYMLCGTVIAGIVAALLNASFF